MPGGPLPSHGVSRGLPSGRLHGPATRAGYTGRLHGHRHVRTRALRTDPRARPCAGAAAAGASRDGARTRSSDEARRRRPNATPTRTSRSGAQARTIVTAPRRTAPRSGMSLGEARERRARPVAGRGSRASESVLPVSSADSESPLSPRAGGPGRGCLGRCPGGPPITMITGTGRGRRFLSRSWRISALLFPS
jgi:hypothetical protein